MIRQGIVGRGGVQMSDESNDLEHESNRTARHALYVAVTSLVFTIVFGWQTMKVQERSTALQSQVVQIQNEGIKRLSPLYRY